MQDYPDPQNWLSIIWRGESQPAKNKGYCNRELDTLTQQADGELDEAKWLRLYQQAHRMLLADVAAPPVFHPSNVFLVQPAVKGFTPTAADLTWPGQWGSLLSIELQQ